MQHADGSFDVEVHCCMMEESKSFSESQAHLGEEFVVRAVWEKAESGLLLGTVCIVSSPLPWAVSSTMIPLPVHRIDT